MTQKSSSKKKVSTPLNGFFHYAERGGTFSGEIAAGISMAILAVCGMFVNMQLVCQYLVTPYAESTTSQIAVNGEMYAITWFASMLVAFIGTLLMALVAKLPVVQVTSLSLSCVLASTISLSSGLTYYNMLAIVFVANVLYLVVAAIPAVRKFVAQGLPPAVRAALPAAAGLLMAWIAAQLSGLFVVSSNVIPNYGTATNLGSGYVATSDATPLSAFSYLTDTYHPQMLLSALAVLLVIVLYVIYARRGKSPFTKTLVWGTVFFLVATILFCGVNWKSFKFALSFLWGRLWMVGAEDAMQAHVSTAIANLGIGKVFSQGFDFSGYTGGGGNVALLVSTGVLSYLFLFMADADSTLTAVSTAALPARTAEATDAPETGEKDGNAMPFVMNAVTNVVSGVLGAPPVALGKESVAGSRDGARSGLSAVVAAIVFIISAFVWVIPALFATITSYSISFNLYGHYGSTLQLLAQTSFSVADAVMMLAGLYMTARSLASIAPDLSSVSMTAPFMATVAATMLLTNLAAGVAAGCVTAALVEVIGPRRKKGAPKKGFVERIGGTPRLVMALVSCALLVLVLL